MATFSDGTDKVFDGDFTGVMRLLCNGRSAFVRDAAGPAKDILAHASSYTFTVVDRDAFNAAVGTLVNKRLDSDVYGFTHYPSKTILLVGYPENQYAGGTGIPRPQSTYLLYALHECVHMASVHYKGTMDAMSTLLLREGLSEGVVEAVAEDILIGQDITKLPKALGHEERLPIARELIRVIGPDVMSSLLFKGSSGVFDQKRKAFLNEKDWKKLQDLAIHKNTREAMRLLGAKG